ncbi:hypothetical protein BBR47_35540 [Brevibacillus brevis NBRC 100599]|uniref:Uncharacterized protein n=1 Tax=Brevibacillus brevis (strain 47 / JCM 6285 / NBRC 100599) TaxID=358681 RepID=C0ZFH2_BREBN|nr:hypothetical protein [Brevibacillus brevis]BAH44531.1 hypothetical protein BBR47_35540 [Brevibacillus brevis NBRC 100599]
MGTRLVIHERVLKKVNLIKLSHNVNIVVDVIDNQSENAKYDPISNKIFINPMNVLNHKMNEYPDLELEEVTELVFCHELGHAFDPLRPNNEQLQAVAQKAICDQSEKSVNDYLDLMVKAEKNAWLNGKQFVSESLRSVYDDDNQKNIARCREMYLNALKNYLT